MVVEDELEVANVLQVDVGTVGQERSELLLDRPLEQQHLPVARVLHQTLNEIGHLQNSLFFYQLLKIEIVFQ